MCKIGKVTLKNTGQELRVIQSVRHTEVTEVLQDALEVARSSDVRGIALVLISEKHTYTDFCGKYDDVSSGSALLNHKINDKWSNCHD